MITFAKTETHPFYKELRREVQAYFRDQGLRRTGEARLLRKSIGVLAVLLLPYALIVTVPMPGWTMLLLCILMGFGMAIVGTNIMHEGCHGAFASNRWLNRLAAGSMYILGGNKLVWQTSHNVLHHGFTNIYGHDVDLEAGNGILRFTEEAEWKPQHAYQHIYAWPLYSLLTFTWIFLTDFMKMRKFRAKGIIYGGKNNWRKNWWEMVAGKLFAVGFWLIIPSLILPHPFWQILLGFLFMHLVAGLSLTLIFQLAHLTPKVDMPVPDQKGNMEEIWAAHQLHTTANWAINSPFFNWACGGLNYQIEHHLFPSISHVHYKALSPIIQRLAATHNLPYHIYPTFGKALTAHIQHLKEMGARPEPQVEAGEGS